MSYTAADFSSAPFIVFYEVTRACDLVCRHCRACAQPRAHRSELTPELSNKLIDQLSAFPKKPVLVFSGGDPLKRPDLEDMIHHANNKGLTPALTPSATPLATYDRLASVVDAGVQAIAISIDGSDAKKHDAIRGIDGSFNKSVQMMQWTRQLGVRLQINTVLTPDNESDLDAIAQLLVEYDVALWSVFFLIPVGRGRDSDRLDAEGCERVFEKLYHYANTMPYAIKTTEAHHYRRYLLQRKQNPQVEKKSHSHSTDKAGHGGGQRAPLGVNDGKGVMFISHTGEIQPSGFLTLKCGRFPEVDPVEIYQSHPLFQDLRNPAGFSGKCGVCEYRGVCGGSRARAFAVHGDPLSHEPDCIYVPKTLEGKEGVTC